MRSMRILLAALLLPAAAFAQLRVVSAAPEGELQTLEQASEIRIVFSEPMIVIGKVPQPVRPPFLRIEPAIEGNFRWSGTNTLIFRPDPAALRYATRFRVTVDASARSIHGSALAAPHTFTFTTPTLRLEHTRWYEKENGAVVFRMDFNQPIDARALVPHIHLGLSPHEVDFSGIQPPPPGSAGAAAFNAKKERVRQAAQSSRKILGFIPDEWDRDRFAEASDALILETQPAIPPGAWLRIAIDRSAPSPGGPEVPAMEQEFVAMRGPGFFVRRATCVSKCNPDYRVAILLTEGVALEDLRKGVTVTDVTDRAVPRVLRPEPVETEDSWDRDQFSLEDLGYTIEPARTLRVGIAPTLRAASGEELGYEWPATIEFWHRTAYSSFGEGHGVWEPEGGPLVPFWARNLRNVKQWIVPLGKEELMPTLLRATERGFRLAPDAQPLVRALRPEADKLQSYGLDASAVLSDDLRGLFWAAVEEGAPIPRSQRISDHQGKPVPKSTIVQATDIGLTLKHSPFGALVWATRLSDASPVAGAAIEIRDRDNRVVWAGLTGSDGVAVAENLSLRKEWWKIEFIAIAESNGDLAYVSNDWDEGILPWEFGILFTPQPAEQHLRGSVFTDRGVYRPGEEIRAKLILRNDAAEEIELLPPGTDVAITVRNPRNDVVAEATVELSSWSSAEWSWTVPSTAVLGQYQLTASLEGRDDSVGHGFLVAAYRRPDFRVDADLGSADAIAGTTLQASVEGRYLFGAPMGGMPARWRYTTERVFTPPDPVRALFPARGFVWTGDCGDDGWEGPRPRVIREDEARLSGSGTLALGLETERDAGEPRLYTIEGEVTDISRQAIAGRASFVVHPAPWYIGLRRSDWFVTTPSTVTTEIAAATPAGEIVPGVKVDVTLTRVQWHSVRRAEGNGFYTWESERREEPAGSWSVTTSSAPVPLQIPITQGGHYVVSATATEDGRIAKSCFSLYAAGKGYTAWQRFDHNRIELLPEQERYAPGETARLLIKSPLETARVLLTTEREGIRSHRSFDLASTQTSIEVPITEEDVPNVFVSVVLVKGRTEGAVDEGGSDPGKPAFRVGYAEIKVEDRAKRLDVKVEGAADELRPGSRTSVAVSVRDSRGAPVDAEVTLWAVDYGVLSLTAYQPPDIAGSVWIDEPLQVITADSRQKIIARRVLTPKGAAQGGGGGADLGANAARSDFRPLAFWIGSVETGADGDVTAEVELPESLTTYRIMAVAADRQSRFGSGEDEIRTNKPVLLRATFPRFLGVGDMATFGAVVANQLRREGTATVTIKSLDPEILEIRGGSGRRIRLGAGSSEEVRFDAAAVSAGRARIEMSVRMSGETDAFRDVVPVLLHVSPETVAAYGTVPPDGAERVAIPGAVLPDIGGLRVELASTALVGLGEGARYLVEYPYGCAEQRASALFAMITAAELGSAFAIPELEIDRAAIQRTIDELAQFQCDTGGFSFWRGDCAAPSPYVTSWLVHVLRLARELGYPVRQEMLDRAYDFLQVSLSDPSWSVTDAAWQAFTIRELETGGRRVDAELNRLFESVDKAPVFAIAWMHDALLARGEGESARASDLRRRLTNAILREGGASHVEEIDDPDLRFYWSSNVRTTAIVLNALVAADADRQLAASLVRWLMDRRRDGRWGSTQENAWAMEALVAFYRKYEAEVPDFAGAATLGDETIARGEFRGRSAEAASGAIPMGRLAPRAGSEVPLTFTKEGTGTLYYGTHLTYARPLAALVPLDQGFTIERSYAPADAEPGSPPRTSFAAGDLVRVTLRIRVPKERIYVAVSDPFPAGFEPVEGWFRTTASDLAQQSSIQQSLPSREVRGGGRETAPGSRWRPWWRSGGFDHIEKHDDRVELFATRLGEGEHVFSYLVRATTSGEFAAAPTRAEEMYSPEVFGRGEVGRVVVGQ